jgi:hypothetical protein
LQEISSFVPEKDKQQFIEARAHHVIASAINLLETIDSSFTEEEALLLKKRFYSSIRNSDPERFSRGLDKLNDDI